MNILIVKLSAIGDVVHTLPALNALRRYYPDAHITWVVEEAAASLVLGHAALDRVIISRRKRWIKQLKAAPGIVISEARTFLRELRDTEYEVILDFQGLLKSAVLVALARGKRKIGFGRGMQHQEASYLFYNEPVPAVDMEVHALLRYIRMLAPLGIPESIPIEYLLPVSQEDRREASRLVKETRNGRSHVAAVNPVAQWDTKLWPPEKFARLADALVERHDTSVVFTGGPEDGPAIERIQALMKNRGLNLAGKTSLPGLAALYKAVDVVVTTDTGPMHIAAAAGAPVVALFGPTAPWRTGPFGDNNRVVRADLSCSPCFKRACDAWECMDRITVDQVLAAVVELRPDMSAD
ncbi:MAG: lipopolysaccharide heptosyltransferase I [Thermodesulfobacteriota bacterium]